MIDVKFNNTCEYIVGLYLKKSQVNPSRKPVWNNRENIHLRMVMTIIKESVY